mmetsp:Transcript_28458/g.67127  ORF Transcript_28458/g.67127 Transcript_28458/m.67127 type:complete len:438 (-) Transcript_28458:489-1802(-)
MRSRGGREKKATQCAECAKRGKSNLPRLRWDAVGHAFLRHIIRVHLQHREGLHYLRVEGIRRLEQVEQLAVVHLQQHARDLARQMRLNVLDQREESLAKQLLLLLGWRRRERCSVDLLRCHLRWLPHRAAWHRCAWLPHWRARLALGCARLPGWRSAGALREALTLLHLPALFVGSTQIASTLWAAAALLHAATACPVAHCHGSAVLAHLLVRAWRGTHHHLLRVHEARSPPLLRHLLRRVEERRTGVGHRLPWHAAVRSALHATHPVARARLVLLLQNVLALLLALCEGNVEGLVGEDVPVHLRDSLRSLLLRVEAHETETLGGALLVAHDLCGRDGAKGREGLAQLLVIHIVVEVLDEKVYAGELVGALHLECLKLVAQLTLSVALLLRATHEHGLAVHLSVVECLACLGSVLVLLEIDEAETTRLALAVLHDDG